MHRDPVTVLHDPDAVVDTLRPFRRRILAVLDTPASATEVARRLETTRQRVNYHMRYLEEAGLVVLHEERQRRGLTERVMRRSSPIVLVDPSAFDTGGLERSDVAGVSGVVSMATDVIRQAAEVATEAGRRRERVAAAVLDTRIRVESPAALRSMLEEVAAAIARHDSGESGLEIRISTSVLPSVDRG